MKKLLFLLLLIIPLQMIAQDTTKLTTREIYNDVKDGFSKLVSNLEGPAKHTYEVYVRKQAIEAGSSIGVLLFAIILGTILALGCWKPSNFEDGNLHAVFVVFGIVMLSTGFLILTVSFPNLIGKVLNPEYYAIQEIIENLK